MSDTTVIRVLGVEIERLEAALDRSKRDAEEARAKMAEKDAHFSSWNRDWLELEGKWEKAVAERNESREAFRIMTQNWDDARVERDAAQAEVTRLTEALKDAEHRVSLLEMVEVRWDADCFTLANHVYPDGEPAGLDVKRLIADATPAFATLAESLEQRERDYNSAHEALADAMAKQATLQAELNGMTADRDALLAVRADLQAQLDTAKAQRDALVHNVNGVDDEEEPEALRQAGAEIEQLTEELKRAKADLSAEIQQNGRLRNEIVPLKAERDELTDLATMMAKALCEVAGRGFSGIGRQTVERLCAVAKDAAAERDRMAAELKALTVVNHKEGADFFEYRPNGTDGPSLFVGIKNGEIIARMRALHSHPDSQEVTMPLPVQTVRIAAQGLHSIANRFEEEQAQAAAEAEEHERSAAHAAITGGK